MKILSRIPSFLRNKFILAGSAFAVWLLFFDKNDLMTQVERRQELKALEESKRHYINEIRAERHFLEDLQTNPAAIEKFAREKYGMKRDNEDLFLIKPAEE